MKAIQVRQFGAPEVLQLEDIPDPKPAAGQVLVRVHAAGANPLDTYLRSGVKVGDYVIKFPWTPGNDAAGVVEALGDGVNQGESGRSRLHSAFDGCLC
jgi:NADPH:quinone reductase